MRSRPIRSVYTRIGPGYAGQRHLDLEKFAGEGVSDASGLGGLTNGNVERTGVYRLGKPVYVARLFTRLMLPLTSAVDTALRTVLVDLLIGQAKGPWRRRGYLQPLSALVPMAGELSDCAFRLPFTDVTEEALAVRLA
jgi:hypothetical protein